MTPDPARPAPDAVPGEATVPAAMLPLMAMACAILGHLQVFGAWWNQDDWGQLGRAAGIVPSSFPAARWVSQDLYWRLMHGLFGLAVAPYTWTRLLLHGGCAALVVRLGARCGLGPTARLAAGLLVAASPLAFTPLYWASGVQTLLGALFALLAVELWLAGGARATWLAGVCGTVSILSKENALLLPVLLAALAWTGARRRDRGAWIAVGVLAVVAAAEAVLVWRHFGHGPGQPYALGGWTAPPLGLAGYGWWLVSPGPFHAVRFTPALSAGGAMVWILWAAWSRWRWRLGDRLPAALLLAATLSLAPVLPLETHAYPYLAYLAAVPGALVLASLIPRRETSAVLILFLCVAALGWSLTVTNVRLKTRDAHGLPADPLVLRTAVSAQAARILRSAPRLDAPDTLRTLYLLQPPAAGPPAELADRMGAEWVAGDLMYTALDGPTGPRLVLDDSVAVRWVNNLRRGPLDAFVMADAGHELLPWGRVPQALLYLAMAEVADGLYQRAALHLLRAGMVSQESMPFLYDRDLMLVPPERIARRADEFRAHLAGMAGPGLTPERLHAVRDIFDELLRIATEPDGTGG